MFVYIVHLSKCLVNNFNLSFFFFKLSLTFFVPSTSFWTFFTNSHWASLVIHLSLFDEWLPLTSHTYYFIGKWVSLVTSTFATQKSYSQGRPHPTFFQIEHKNDASLYCTQITKLFMIDIEATISSCNQLWIWIASWKRCIISLSNFSIYPLLIPRPIPIPRFHPKYLHCP